MKTAIEKATAEKINDEHRAVEEAVSTVLQHAIKAGELLVEAKNGVGHGQWGAWLRENFEGSERAAQAYMRVYRRRNEIRNGAADLSLRGALNQLSVPAEKPAATNPSKPEPKEAGELREKAIHALIVARDEDERAALNREIDRLECIARPVDIPNMREWGTLKSVLSGQEMYLPLVRASAAFAARELQSVQRIAKRKAAEFREKGEEAPRELYDDVEEAKRHLKKRRRRAAKLGGE